MASLPSASCPEEVPRIRWNPLEENVIGGMNRSAAPAPPEEGASRGHRLELLPALRTGRDSSPLLHVFRRFSRHVSLADRYSGSPTSPLRPAWREAAQAPPPFRSLPRPPAGSGTAHVGTPSFGSTTHCRSSQAAKTLTRTRTSPQSLTCRLREWRPCPVRSLVSRYRSGVQGNHKPSSRS